MFCYSQKTHSVLSWNTYFLKKNLTNDSLVLLYFAFQNILLSRPKYDFKIKALQKDLIVLNLL